MSDWLASALRLATPLLFAAMGGLLSERSGIATVCLEGVMLIAAFAAATIAALTQNLALAILGALFAGTLAMMLHAYLSLYQKADQVVSSMAINLLAIGITPFLCNHYFGSPTNTPSLPLDLRVPSTLLTCLALVIAAGEYFAFRYTRWGIWIPAVGDHPDASKSCGISPKRVRRWTLLVAGLFTSMGGIYLSISHGSQFTREMTAGRGFIALAAIIFGKWKPGPTIFACLFFGGADALQIVLQNQPWLPIPVQFLQIIPYAATLFILIGVMGKCQAPLSIGKVQD